jgi:hypothetical protein
MMLRTPVCSYPIIVSHLSFNVLCLLILYSIYLSGYALLPARPGYMACQAKRLRMLVSGYIIITTTHVSRHREAVIFVIIFYICYILTLRYHL